MRKKIASLVALCVIALGFGLTGSAMADPSNVGKLKISEYGTNAAGTDKKSNRNEEFVRLVNKTAGNVDMEGWTVHDNNGPDHANAYVFKGVKLPAGHKFRVDHDSNPATADHFVMPVGGQIYVYSGAGTDTTPTSNTAAIYRDLGDATWNGHMWNNAGDTYHVRDADDTLTNWVRYTLYRAYIDRA